VLGLADEIGRDQTCIRRGVRDDEDLGRTGLRVRADDAGDRTLRGRDVVVAGS
jgi:hypothetical protein